MGPFDTALLASVITLATPILLVATGELVAERSGVLNIGLEGMMLTGALSAFMCAHYAHSSVVGSLGGALGGMLMAAIVAALAIEARADQMVVGIGINILAAGATAFIFRSVFTGEQIIAPRFPTVEIPLLSKIPVVGEAFFSQNLMVYFAFAAIALAAPMLSRTNWGLAIRASGELPEAADTAGVSVRRVRWLTTLGAGFGAGLGGAYLVLGGAGIFTEGISGGRGYLALAVVIFAKWRARGVLFASLFFGAAEALQLRLQASNGVPSQVWVAVAILAGATAVYMALRPSLAGGGRPRFEWTRPRARPIVYSVAIACLGIGLALANPSVSLPTQLWLAVPYVAALLALAGVVGRSRMPSALGIPYVRGN